MTSTSRIFDLERFNQSGGAPLYGLVKRLVRNAVTAGELRDGDQIPSERDVAEALHISRVTVRKAFSDLVADGVLVQRRGSGTYVNAPMKRIEHTRTGAKGMSHMASEAAEAPDAVARFLTHNAPALADLGHRLRQAPPPVVLTSARGSSGNAAGYFKYLTEILLGVPCASIGASVVSVYGSALKAKGAVCLTISQSGQSPDIVGLQEEAKRAGALTVALVNVAGSPAAISADICLPLQAGAELSVAATKSFIVSCVAGAAITAHWLNRPVLLDAVQRLPETLAQATRIEWPEFTDFAGEATSLYVLGRGPSLPIAAETALKLKETCGIHAEAYSVAEVMHGPWELMRDGFPVLAYAPDDAAFSLTQVAVAKMRGAGAKVLLAGSDGLSVAASGEPLLDPVSMILTAYLAIEKLAKAMGRDPDRPRLLKKVTETT